MLRDIRIFSIVFEAVRRDQVSAFDQVFHKDELPYYGWIHLPTDIAKYLDLVEVKNVDTDKDVDFHLDWEREDIHPWYKLRLESLDLTLGTHMYRLKFDNTFLHDELDLYFRYTIQDDNPDKPYVYMNRSEGEDK